jgi:hypothetical protein
MSRIRELEIAPSCHICSVAKAFSEPDGNVQGVHWIYAAHLRAHGLMNPCLRGGKVDEITVGCDSAFRDSVNVLGF